MVAILNPIFFTVEAVSYRAGIPTQDILTNGITMLAFLGLLRTALSWTLSMEIEGRWPWQPSPEDADGLPTPGQPVQVADLQVLPKPRSCLVVI